MALMGLDIGSTGCKAMVFSDDGKPLSHAYSEYESCTSIFETNGNIIWNNAREVMSESAFGIKDKIKAIKGKINHFKYYNRLEV